MHISRAVVSEAFRLDLANLVPELGNNQAYWRTASYLLFPSQADHAHGNRILMGHKLIFALMGHKQGQVAHDRIQEFSNNVWPVTLSGWRYGWSTEPDECRHVQSMVLPAGVEKLVSKELRSPRSGRLVYLDTGASYNPRAAKAERDALQSLSFELAEANNAQRAKNLESIQNSGCQLAYDLLTYLNTQAPHRYSKMLSHIDEAMEAARSHRDARNQLTQLGYIQAQSKPYYMPTERTLRIFSLNASILRLAAPVRECLTQDWISCDLQSCQLAVCAARWNGGIPSVLAYLNARAADPTAPSIWSDLATHMGLPLDDSKAILKEALYSLIFGRSTKNLKAFLCEELPGVINPFERFTSHRLIADMLEARKAEFKSLKAQGYGVDAFGTKIYPEIDDKGTLNYRGVLAICAQSYEMALLAPVIQTAISRTDKSGISLTLWLHDGFCFEVNRDTDKQRAVWSRKLKALVDARAKELGIPTSLIINH